MLLELLLTFDLNFSNLQQQYVQARNHHIEEIYLKVAKATGQDYPPFRIEENESINAYATSEEIVLFTGMINFSNANDDEIALILGHELGHYILDHVNQPVPDLKYTSETHRSKKYELNSDKIGAFLMTQAGYDVCKGRELWKRMKDTFGDIVEKDSHPNAIFRYENLKTPNCK